MEVSLAAQLLATAGVVAIVLGLMAWNHLDRRRRDAQAPPTPTVGDYVLRSGTVVGQIRALRNGQALLGQGENRHVVRASELSFRGGEWVLAEDASLDEADGSWS